MVPGKSIQEEEHDKAYPGSALRLPPAKMCLKQLPWEVSEGHA